MNTKIILILDNIRSVHNAGSIFRTADGFGVSEIFLCGTTPTPFDRFGRERSDFSKVSLGAEKTIPWKFFETTEDAIQEAKEKKFHIVALEQSSRSIPLHTFKTSKSVALILGAEVVGISETILDLCDEVIEIPMSGTKESFNVSVAGGIAMYVLRNM